MFYTGLKLFTRALFKKNIFDSFKLDLPKVGSTKISTVDNTKIIALQPNQYFFMYKRISYFPVDELKFNVGIGYYSDQSDSWSIIKISGENTIPALERICLLYTSDAADE
mgnify:CR=1 FL=1